jgi:hypothetical protein
MKITDNRGIEPEATYEDLKEGDVFRFDDTHGGSPLIKTSDGFTVLRDGFTSCCEPDCIVTPLDAELIIHGEL